VSTDSEEAMHRTDVVIIGAGQAGLAVSRCLVDRGIDHVVLDRGRIAERWRSERWASLRLLTPNWQSRLPGWWYRGPDPNGFMTVGELIAYLEGYARSFGPPVQHATTVLRVERRDTGYRVHTDRGDWQTCNVVIATGDADQPATPHGASRLSQRVHQVTPSTYRRPDDLPPGGTLVVGASSSGVQLAEEIHRSGRSVTLAVGRHTRLPRTYRGRDILWWLDRMGTLDRRAEDHPDLRAARQQPSLQLVGSAEGRMIDLPALQGEGVRLVGRFVAADGERVGLADDLGHTTAAADAKLGRILTRIDDFIGTSGLGSCVGARSRPSSFVPHANTKHLDLRRENIATVIWATGFRRSYPWLAVPVVDAWGEVRHRGGITPSPGLYIMGLGFMRRRKSSFIDGVGADAAELVQHMALRLERRRAAA
jgi:putative flavoprotein involved in K+ transport